MLGHVLKTGTLRDIARWLHVDWLMPLVDYTKIVTGYTSVFVRLIQKSFRRIHVFVEYADKHYVLFSYLIKDAMMLDLQPPVSRQDMGIVCAELWVVHKLLHSGHDVVNISVCLVRTPCVAGV